VLTGQPTVQSGGASENMTEIGIFNDKNKISKIFSLQGDRQSGNPGNQKVSGKVG
jgi:hypothetical protein